MSFASFDKLTSYVFGDNISSYGSAEVLSKNCPEQYLGYELCKKAHGEYAKCQDAVYDLEACVLKKMQLS
jgi:hypothetical protein